MAFTHKFTVVVSRPMLDHARRVAKRRGCTVADYIRHLVIADMERDQPHKKAESKADEQA